VTTCLLTWLSTIGASRQKQILRLAGALVGGFVIGMGWQIFILLHLDSIGGFTLLFVLVTALSSWLLTSSPRLSYFGLQVALAFYLINLQEFAMQTSLSVARDRVVGILLGLFMMWLVFDQLVGRSESGRRRYGQKRVLNCSSASPCRELCTATSTEARIDAIDPERRTFQHDIDDGGECDFLLVSSGGALVG
jgi:uncharacterized membrane protein YccC